MQGKLAWWVAGIIMEFIWEHLPNPVMKQSGFIIFSVKWWMSAPIYLALLYSDKLNTNKSNYISKQLILSWTGTEIRFLNNCKMSSFATVSFRDIQINSVNSQCFFHRGLLSIDCGWKWKRLHSTVILLERAKNLNWKNSFQYSSQLIKKLANL